jgi:cytochrome bd ubiquinol oxidase subunit I
VLLSLIGYMVVYLVMFPTGFLLIRRVVRNGIPATDSVPPVAGGRPAAPVVPPPGAAT